MSDTPATQNPLIEKAIQDHSNATAFKSDIADIVKADIGNPQKIAQDAQQLEQQLQMKPADLVKLGFPSTILSNDNGGSTPAVSQESSAAKTAQVKVDAQNRPDEVDYPNGMVATVSRDQNGQIDAASITGGPDKSYDGTFKIGSDGLLHEYATNGKDAGVTVKPGDVQIAADGAVQVIAKEKVTFLNFSGYIDVDPQGNATKHTGSPPGAVPS